MSYANVYKNIDKRTLEATKKLIQDGIWKDMLIEDKLRICNQWLQAVSKIYKVEVPELVFSDDGQRYYSTGGGSYIRGTIFIYLKWSLVTLIHEFRHHLQYISNIHMYRNNQEEDARAWSVSIFKNVAPKSYQKSVENGTLKFS